MKEQHKKVEDMTSEEYEAANANDIATLGFQNIRQEQKQNKKKHKSEKKSQKSHLDHVKEELILHMHEKYAKSDSILLREMDSGEP